MEAIQKMRDRINKEMKQTRYINHRDTFHTIEFFNTNLIFQLSDQK